MPHQIIQAEVDEFERAFSNVAFISDAEHARCKRYFCAALHRAVESAGKEMEGERSVSECSCDEETCCEDCTYVAGENSQRDSALSKLDTIINFKE